MIELIYRWYCEKDYIRIFFDNSNPYDPNSFISYTKSKCGQ